MRLVTLNCLFLKKPRARLRVIARLLSEMSPDVACLQEIFFKRNVSLLADDRAIFRPWGFSVLGGLVTLAGGVETWRFESFRTTVWFERTARKGFLITRLLMRGEPMTIVNTHLAANYDDNWSLDNRYAKLQLDELSQLAEAIDLLPQNEPLVVAGDFNVPADAPQFKEFKDRCGLQSAMEWSSVAASSRNARGIDNILFRPPAGRPMIGRAALCFQDQVRLPDGRSVYPSDHMGLVAELNW
jgi:endonuclease/exonuclease/phosphatase family metal-dependent hydrolase